MRSQNMTIVMERNSHCFCMVGMVINLIVGVYTRIPYQNWDDQPQYKELIMICATILHIRRQFGWMAWENKIGSWLAQA